MTQIEFVKQLPAELPVEEVIEQAKAQGLKLRPARVQVIRRLMRKKSHLTLVTSKPKHRAGRPSRERSLELDRQRLVSLVFKLGIVETQLLIKEARAKIMSDIAIRNM